jgi:hypothetical protein
MHLARIWHEGTVHEQIQARQQCDRPPPTQGRGDDGGTGEESMTTARHHARDLYVFRAIQVDTRAEADQLWKLAFGD